MSALFLFVHGIAVTVPAGFGELTVVDLAAWFDWFPAFAAEQSIVHDAFMFSIGRIRWFHPQPALMLFEDAVDQRFRNELILRTRLKSCWIKKRQRKVKTAFVVRVLPPTAGVVTDVASQNTCDAAKWILNSAVQEVRRDVAAIPYSAAGLSIMLSNQIRQPTIALQLLCFLHGYLNFHLSQIGSLICVRLAVQVTQF